MTVEPRLSDLLLAWEEARSRGQQVSAEELCRDWPELTPALEQHIRALRSLTPVLDLSPYDDGAAPANGGPADRDSAPADLGSLAGYDLLEELGQGGTGVVYKARQTGLDRVVAIKMLLGGHFAGQIALKRFRAEAQTLAQLRHPHIVQIHDIGSHQGSPYFVLEYLDGGDLSELLDGKPLDPVEAARLVEVLARTVHTVHQAGIIHRDLKPGNVLLEKVASPPATKPAGAVQLRGQWFVPKLTDFGLARAAESNRHLTATGVAIGTPVFMAPEQAQGKKNQIGPATDVYSLGVLMYQLLTGTFPFGTEAMWHTMQHVISKRPEPPSRRNPACPRELEAICLRCLEKEPRHRYPSADRLADDLRCFLEGLPVSACRPWWARLSRRGWLTSGALAALGLAAAVVVFVLAATASTPQIKIGIATVRSGPQSYHAQAIRDGVWLAVQELNEQDDRYDIIEVPAAADAADVARTAEEWMAGSKVDVLIGGATSEERQALLPVVAKHRHLLMVPVVCPGYETSEFAVFLGPTAEQLCTVGGKWAANKSPVPPQVIVGNRSPFSWVAHELLQSRLVPVPGKHPLTNHLVSLVDQLPEFREEAWFKGADKSLVLGVDPGEMTARVFQRNKEAPSPRWLFFSLTEADWRQLSKDLAGHYVVSSYVPEGDSAFGRRQAKYGAGKAFDTTASAYAAVHLWAKAARQADSRTPTAVRAALKGQHFDGLGQRITLSDNGYAQRFIAVHQIAPDGTFHLEQSDKALLPNPAPAGKTQAGWDEFLSKKAL